MEPGERLDTDQQPALLTQALQRARRVHEVLGSHQADLLRHAQSAGKDAGLPNDPNPTALLDGADRVRRAVDATSRLIEALARAVRIDQDGHG